MEIDAQAIARIDATLLPNLDRHHLRLLAHCLQSFQSMESPNKDGHIPDHATRLRWCEQQPIVFEDQQFLTELLRQLDGAAFQLESLAKECGKPPMQLNLEDLIRAAQARCRD